MIGDNLSDKICAEKSNIRFAYKDINFLKQLKIFVLNILGATKIGKAYTLVSLC